MDISLAVFAIKNCWEVKDVAHFKLNTMTTESPKLTPNGQANLQKFNWADFILYDHFVQKLRTEVNRIGREKVENFAAEIKRVSEQLKNECLEETSIDFMKNFGKSDGSLLGSHEEELHYKPNGIIFNPKVKLICTNYYFYNHNHKKYRRKII